MIFPKWTNSLPLVLGAIAALAGAGVAAGVTIYLTPKFYRVGYQPVQPVPFSHRIHAGQLALDCRYCHNGVEKSWFANLPGASTCMNCHNQVLKDDPRLQIVRDSATNNTPIAWVQVHKVPDYVYFNHSVHVTRGISCVECHGRIDQMDEVKHAESLSMSFCLDCHRNPEKYVRPRESITTMGYEPAGNQEEIGTRLVAEYKIQDARTLTSCSTCHR